MIQQMSKRKKYFPWQLQQGNRE